MGSGGKGGKKTACETGEWRGGVKGREGRMEQREQVQWGEGREQDLGDRGREGRKFRNGG